MTEENKPDMPDELLAAVDRVAAVQIDPATFPHDPPLEFRAAAVELLNQISRLRFQMDGGDLADLDELGVGDPSIMVNLDDLHEFVAGFYDEGDQARYSACRAVAEWVAVHREQS